MARLFGIPVHVSPYWFIIAGVFIIIYANELSGSLQGATTRYLVAAAFVVLLYVSVLFHELSHSVVAQGFGLPVRLLLLATCHKSDATCIRRCSGSPRCFGLPANTGRNRWRGRSG